MFMVLEWSAMILYLETWVTWSKSSINKLIEMKFKLLKTISHYYNNIFAFHMPMFTSYVLSLNKLNTIIHSNIIFIIIPYNQNLDFRIHYKKL
jgi:hypothetical protein